MKRSLQGKLIFSYLVIALITVLVVSALIRLTSGQSLMNLVMEQQTAMLNEAVQSYYTENATLDGFFDYYLQQNRRDNPPPTQPDGIPDKGPGMGDIRGVHGLVDLEYRALMPTFNYEIG
ncbi:MAG TPA: hypothetical protein PLA25_09430, partial [Anaerolineaceae bacterium]|nr:hypothetical protein [Anaerolineaceae bacterium]